MVKYDTGGLRLVYGGLGMTVYGIPAEKYGFIHIFQSSEMLRDAVDHDLRMHILLDENKDFPGVFIAGSVRLDSEDECQAAIQR